MKHHQVLVIIDDTLDIHHYVPTFSTNERLHGVQLAVPSSAA